MRERSARWRSQAEIAECSEVLSSRLKQNRRVSAERGEIRAQMPIRVK
jgi:hypothetical protein